MPPRVSDRSLLPKLTRGEVLRGAGLAAAGALLSPLWTRAATSDEGRATPPLIEIAPGAFVHHGHHAVFSPVNAGDVCNTAVVIGSQSVAVIDTGGSLRVGAALRSAIRAITDRPISHVINTHMHPDHVLGNAAFLPDQPIFAGHQKLARALTARVERYMAANRELIGAEAFAGTQIVPPTLAVEKSVAIDLGGRTLTLTARRTAHTDNDLTVRDSATQTIFTGDIVFLDHAPTLDGSIRGWLALLEDMSAEPARLAVPGHGPASAEWPAALVPVQRYLRVVAEDVRRLIRQGRTLSQATMIAGQSEKDAWQLFPEYHARNVSAAFAELEWE